MVHEYTCTRVRTRVRIAIDVYGIPGLLNIHTVRIRVYTCTYSSRYPSTYVRQVLVHTRAVPVSSQHTYFSKSKPTGPLCQQQSLVCEEPMWPSQRSAGNERIQHPVQRHISGNQLDGGHNELVSAISSGLPTFNHPVYPSTVIQSSARSHQVHKMKPLLRGTMRLA